MLTDWKGIAQYAEQTPQNSKSEGVPYVDDSQIYDYDHQNDDHGHRPQSRAAQHNYGDPYADQNQQYGRQDNEYHNQYGRTDRKNHEDDEEMW